jgi:protein-tyrosine-phosphatase
VIEPMSAGLMPGFLVAPIARQVMAERRLSLDDHFPKGLHEVDANRFDLIVNISGRELPTGIKPPVHTWHVPDPVGGEENEYRNAADEIEDYLNELIAKLRSEPRP